MCGLLTRMRYLRTMPTRIGPHTIVQKCSGFSHRKKSTDKKVADTYGVSHRLLLPPNTAPKKRPTEPRYPLIELRCRCVWGGGGGE